MVLQIQSTQMESERKVSRLVFFNKTRYFLLIMVSSFLTLLQINTLTFNFAVICMSDIVDNFHSQNIQNNQTHWFEDANKKSLVFSSLAIGGLLGLLLAVPLMHRLGVRIMLSVCAVFSVVGTLSFPVAADFHYFGVLTARFFQGLGTSLVFTTIGFVPVAWAPKDESSTFLAVLSCAFQMSNVICMPISGILCESALGWRYIYYISGFTSLLLLIIFFVFYTDTPTGNRNVSNKELNIILHDKPITHKEPVPYWKICKDPCVLVNWLSNVGGNLGALIHMLYGPTYLREVLHFDVRGTGFASALPFFICVVTKYVAGRLSDKCVFLSERVRFTICAVTSRLGLSVGYIVMATTSSRTVAQLAFTFSIAITGLNVLGTIKCLQLRCRQHVHFAVSVIALLAYVIQFGAPILVGFICPNNTPNEWARMFIIIGIVVFVTNVPFPIFTTADPAEYTLSVSKRTESQPNEEFEEH